MIWSADVDGASTSVWENLVAKTDNDVNPGATGIHSIRLGNNFSEAFPAAIDVAGVIVVFRKVNSTERIEMVNWLNAKYDIFETAIPGATSSTYTLTEADEGMAVWCEVTATNLVGTEWADSNVVYPTASAKLTIAEENALPPGITAGYWGLSGAGDLANQGFCREFSLNVGETAHFSVQGDCTQIEILRVGYYGGVGMRKVTTITNTPNLSQPAPVSIPSSNGCTQCSSWTTTASWPIPDNATPGMYIGLVRNAAVDNGSWVPFIVRDDDRPADVMIKSSDATWALAYNYFNNMTSPLTGKSFYGSNGPMAGGIENRGHAMSYHRPIVTHASINQTYPFYDEFPLVRFLERNGVDVTYSACKDWRTGGPTLADCDIYVSNGHDEYWSQAMRDKWEALRDAGKKLMFFGGNIVFWRTREADGGDTLWCYKDTMTGPSSHVAGTALDPVSWTGTWKDTRPANNATRDPEWTLTGGDFRMNGVNYRTMVIPSGSAPALTPFWRNTTVAASGLTVTHIIGMEGDELRPLQPAENVAILAQTTVNIDGNRANDDGETYSGSGNLNWGVVLQRYSGGGVSVSFNTCTWAWGLDNDHETASGGSTTLANTQMQQATLNLFADLGALPTTLMAGLTMPTPVTLDDYADPAVDVPPLADTDIEYRLSGGASNTSPSASLGGAMSTVGGGLITSGVLHNLFDVIAGAEAAGAQVDNYRCIYVRNKHSTDNWQAPRIWVKTPSSSADTELAIAVGGEGVGGTAETVANEITAPSGELFSAPATKETALIVSDVGPAGFFPLWIRRRKNAAAAATASDTATLRVESGDPVLPPTSDEYNLYSDTPSGYSTEFDGVAITVAEIFYCEDAADHDSLVCRGMRMFTSPGFSEADLTGCWGYLWKFTSIPGGGETGTLLVAKAFPAPLISGAWNELRWDTEIPITADPSDPVGGYYMVGCYLPEGGYAYKNGVHISLFNGDDPRLFGATESESNGNGRYRVGHLGATPGSPVWPVNYFNQRHYGPDVILADVLGVPTETYEEAVRADTPVAYWQMGDSGTSQPEDGGGTPMVLTGATTGVAGATTQLGNAVSFDGVNDYGRVSSLNLSAANKITVECWLKWDTYDNNDSLALEHGESNQARGWTWDPDSSATVWAAFSPQGAATGFSEEYMNPRPSAGEWHHIVVTFDRTVGTLNTGNFIKFYVDGVEKTGNHSGAAESISGNFQTYPLMVMARSAPGDGTKNLFAGGDMQHLAIYDYLLSSIRVAAHYDARSTGGPLTYSETVLADNPHRYWRMGQASGSEPDETGGGGALTITGMTRNVAGALAFDDDGAVASTSGYGQVALNLSDTEDVTVEMGVWWNAYANDDALLFEHTPNWNSNNGALIFDFNSAEGNCSIGFLVTGGKRRFTFPRSAMSAAAWHHLVVVFSTNEVFPGDGNPGACRLYIDGAPVTLTIVENNVSATDTTFANSTFNLLSRNGASLFGGGRVDELAIYKAALTSGQVTAHYAAFTAG